MTDDAQRGTLAPTQPNLLLVVERALYGRELTRTERMDRLAAEFSLEFGPLLNILDFPQDVGWARAQATRRRGFSGEPANEESIGTLGRWSNDA